MRTLGHLFFHHPETIRDAAKGVAVKQGTVRQSWTRPVLSKQKVTPASSIQQPTPTLSTKPLRLTDPAVTTQSPSPLTPNSAAPFASALSACYRPSGCF